jgi:hypothetical protein
MIQCLIHRPCTTHHLSLNAIRPLRRLSRSIPRCMTRCLIRHRCAILRHGLNSLGLRLLNVTAVSAARELVASTTEKIV